MSGNKDTKETPPPSKPVESPAVTANQTSELPQPVAADGKDELTPAQKAAQTREKARQAPAKRDPNARASESNRLTPQEVADQIVAGSQKWMNGRERDILLAEQGYDLNEMRREIQYARVRASKKAAE